MAEDETPWTRDMGDLTLSFDGYWVWVRSKQTTDLPVMGKYLFFSEDPDRLQEIAFEEIRHHGFYSAKYNRTPLGSNTDCVLCLYSGDDSRKSELADRAREYGVRYRYWKPDADTLRGRYSTKFLGKLSPEDRERFTRDKLERRTQDPPVVRARSKKPTARPGRRPGKREKARR